MIQHLKGMHICMNQKRWIWDPFWQGERRDGLSVHNAMGEQEVLAAVILKIIKWIKTNVRDRPTVIVIDPSREKATGNQIDW